MALVSALGPFPAIRPPTPGVLASQEHPDRLPPLDGFVHPIQPPEDFVQG